MPPPILRSGPWDLDDVAGFLRSAVMPIRLATVGSDGAPLVQSLWFAAEVGPGEGSLWCATRHDAVVVARLAREPRVAFEVAGDAMPYRGVRGTGVAGVRAERGGEVLRRLLDRYDVATVHGLGAWLLSRVDEEVAVEISDLELVTWDYTDRMGGR